MQEAGVRRFTRDGSAALEVHLESVCAAVVAGVRTVIPASRLDGVLLGGGYGRGEGGVWRAEGGDRPYNDLEFYVVVRGPAPWMERRHRGALHALGHRLSPVAGVEVEFKVISPARLRTGETTMFLYDLVAGHRQLAGTGLPEECGRHHNAARIPLSEATRLLMNRCSGLLFSAERLARGKFGAAEADFVGRNHAKAQLALGDVLLTAAGRYHWSCLERHRRLSDLARAGAPAMEPIRRHHAAGVEFKLHPEPSTASREALLVRQRELCELAGRVWLWLESLRLGDGFATARDYALGATDKCPETPHWRNRLVTAEVLGWRAAGSAAGARYPRQRLLHALALLLWEPEAVRDPVLAGRLRAELVTRADTFSGFVAAYEKLWHRFN